VEHRKAQQEGRDLYYAEYHLQVCEVIRESRFERRE
jgi:heme-degrading monooxygenase HmoA